MTAPTVDRDVDTKALRSYIETKTAAAKDAAAALTFDADGNGTMPAEAAAEFKRLHHEATEAKTLLDQLGQLDEMEQWSKAPTRVPVAAYDAAAAAVVNRPQVKDLGTMFIESKAYKERDRSFNPSMINIGADFDSANLLDISEESARALLEGKAIYGGGTTPSGGTATIPGLGQVQSIGISEARLRQKRVRDLFPTASTKAVKLYGVRETGFTNNAAVVKVRNAGAFTTKPESDLTLVPISYDVARIAHYLVAHKDILDDEPRLRDFLNRRMVDGIRLAEDAKILYGTGGSEDIQGITTVSGVQTYTGAATDPLTAQIRRAATLAMIAEYEPNGLVLHPIDWERLELEPTKDGVYRLSMNIAVGGERRIWGMDIVQTTAMASAHYLLGAFGLGAQWYDREQVNVVASSEDATNFRQNLITIRAESRGVMAIDRPEAFVYGTLTTPT